MPVASRGFDWCFGSAWGKGVLFPAEMCAFGKLNKYLKLDSVVNE